VAAELTSAFKAVLRTLVWLYDVSAVASAAAVGLFRTMLPSAVQLAAPSPAPTLTKHHIILMWVWC